MANVYETGIPGLDQVLQGGFVREHSVMIEGYTGTGKTVLGMSLLEAGISQFRENAVLVSFEQLPESLYRDAVSLEWDFRARERANQLRVVFVSAATLVEEISAQISKIGDLIVEIDARRLFIDGINMLETVQRDSYLRRQLIDQVIAAFRREGLSVYFSREKPESTPLGAAVESYIADMVIQLTYVQQHGRRIRYLEVVKSRGQEIITGLHTFKIGRGGMTVFPRQKVPIVNPLPVVYGEPRATFGVPDLDEMLGGGVFRRSSTMVAGSSGTGKSILGLQFLLHGARTGERGIYVSLEEPSEQIADHARSIAPDADELLRSGMLAIMNLSPLETDINEQIIQVRDTLARLGAKRLTFDSLSNYQDLFPQEAYKDYIFALLSFVKGSGVTSLFTEEIRELTVVEKITSHGTSYLLDNIIMLRYVELANALRRAIVVLKTRGSDHANDIREYVITREGIKILPIDPGVAIPVLSLQQYSHILTPFPAPRERGGEPRRRRQTQPPGRGPT